MWPRWTTFPLFKSLEISDLEIGTDLAQLGHVAPGDAFVGRQILQYHLLLLERFKTPLQDVGRFGTEPAIDGGGEMGSPECRVGVSLSGRVLSCIPPPRGSVKADTELLPNARLPHWLVLLTFALDGLMHGLVNGGCDVRGIARLSEAG